MDKEEFQKKYDNSILVCCTEDNIKKVFNICDLMDLTASKSKQATAILIGEQTAKSPLFHVEQFLNDFYNEVAEPKKKKTILFKQKMKDVKDKIRHKYNNEYIMKGTDTGTVVETLQALGMDTSISPMNDAIQVGEGGKVYPAIYQSRQFITDVMSAMIDVLSPFLNKEIMIDTDNTHQNRDILDETYFYIRNVVEKQIYIGEDEDTFTVGLCMGVERIRLDTNSLDAFRKAFYMLYKCNEWIKKDDEKNKKEPTFSKGNRIMNTIEDDNGNTYTVTKLSERVYESKEHNILFITNEEGVVIGIYKER